MQKLAFPLRGHPDDTVTPDGYAITTFWPNELKKGSKQVVLAVLREPNTKHQWNVYTRVMERENVVRYDDGLEFRHREDLAREAFSRRVDELKGQ